MGNMIEQVRTEPKSITDCFTFDICELNPELRGILRKLWAIKMSSRYSMPVFMRLCQYFYSKGGRFNLLLSSVFARMNQVNNNFEHGVNPKIVAGVIFHHPSVCITSSTIIERSVHIYRNVTFGAKDGKAPHIKKYAKIASHSIVLGGVTVGERAIVALGAVVVKDVPDNTIVAGVPASVIGDVTDDNYNF